MPLDYRILQQAPQPVQPNTLGSLGNILAVGNLMDQDRAAQQKAEADRVLAQLSAQFANDPEKAIPELYRLGFTTQARELEDHVDKRKKALFDIRKAELDGDLTAGRISAEKAKAERDAMDAESPEKMAPYFAAAENDNDWQNAAALARLKFREKAEPFIAQMGAFDPAKAKFAGRVVMGPEKVAIDVDRDLTRQQALTIAEGQQETARRGQDISAETQRRGQDVSAATTRRGQDLTDKRETPTGTPSNSDKAMVAAIMKNPQIYETLTPTMKTRLAVPLTDAGFNFAQKVVQDGKPSTGLEKRAMNFFNRAKQSDEELANVEETIAQSGTAAQFWREYMPNFMQTAAGQQYTAAQRAFTEARLRKDSGAAIPPSEFTNDQKTYFVQAGDDAATIKQKQRARAAILSSLAFESGRALGEFYGDDAQAMIEGYKKRSAQPSSKLTKEIPGFPGSLAESTDGGKTWKRIK